MEAIKVLNQSVVSERVITSYGDKAYYAVSACARELILCLKELVFELKSENIPKTRLILHKMLGPSRIIGQQNVEEQIKKIQQMVKHDIKFKYPHKEIKQIQFELEYIKEQLVEERPFVNILIYSDKMEFLNKVITELSDWDYSNMVMQAEDLKSIEYFLSKELPDVLIVIGRHHGNEFWGAIKEIKNKYLGTSLLFHEFKKELFTESYMKKIQESIKKSVTA